MKYLIKITMVLFFIVAQNYSYAVAGWSGLATVKGIYTLDENRALIKLSNFTNPHGCKINESGDVIVNPTTQKTWFSVLLTAYMGKKTVNIYVNSACTEVWAETSYATIGHVRLL